MPEFTVIHVVLLAAMAIFGTAAGWKLRGDRARREKAAVNAGWQEQVEAQRNEHARLTQQNRGLMEQISQYQASNKDAKNRASELAGAIQEAFGRRDELQGEVNNIRGKLEIAVAERDQLQSDIRAKVGEDAQLQVKNTQIAKLRLELENWQNRVPPLVERFRQRNEEAERLEAELTVARERIAELDAIADTGQTRIESLRDPESLTNGRGASNDSLQQQALDYDEPDSERPEPAQAEARDELQRIKGVGPAIEKTLNEMGFFRYHQIAEMSEYDIDRVANRLKGFHSRIHREDWIGQARELRDQIIRG